MLQARASLSKTDPRLIELYAMNYGLARKAYETIEADGTTVESDRGNVSEHPSIQTLNAATIRLKAIMNDLGLTPSSAKVAGGSRASAPSGYDYWESKLKGAS
jgi:P27 family predicted phage terminase small subunit